MDTLEALINASHAADSASMPVRIEISRGRLILRAGDDARGAQRCLDLDAWKQARFPENVLLSEIRGLREAIWPAIAMQRPACSQWGNEPCVWPHCDCQRP